MSAPSLKELCLEQIVASADRFLSLQWSDGRFEVVPEHETDEWNFFQQQYTLPAAISSIFFSLKDSESRSSSELALKAIPSIPTVLSSSFILFLSFSTM